jgi:hypothetical protein
VKAGSPSSRSRPALAGHDPLNAHDEIDAYVGTPVIDVGAEIARARGGVA